ncbi:flippase [Geobacter sp. FeAm09]|uniref:flippase n=1 Tax=Geobacter sp. FeAm09 TaxID=2597769 RepID=UPI0011F00EDB|nr:flippase [Geobacter sp. FeAm09]QEM66797.1 flippase [Geobacter sp. FeAm09]
MDQGWTRYLPAPLRRRVEGHPALQRVIGNTGWLFVDNILRMGVGLLVSIWVTRYLGPEQFGLLSYTTAFVMLFSSALLGLDSIVVRNIVRNPLCRDEVLGSAFVLKLAGGIAAFFVMLAAITIIRPGDPTSRLLVGITAIGTLFQSVGVIDFWFQSQVRSKYSAYARSIAYLLTCTAKIALIAIHAPLAAFAWAGVADIALGSFGLAVAYRATGQKITAWRATRAMAKELLRDSWPLMFTEIVMLVYMRIDKIMIGEMVGNAELGIYSVATLIAEALYFIPTALATSIFPGVVAAREVSEEYFHERLQQYYNLMVLFAYLVAVPITFLAGGLVPLMFGAAYTRAAPMLVGLVWAGIFINLAIARGHYLTVMNLTRLNFVTDLLGCLLNVALNFFLIPRYGGMGAMAASCVSYWFVAHGTCFAFKDLSRTGAMMNRAIFYPKVW